MVMAGHMSEAQRKQWAVDNRQAQIDSAEEFAKQALEQFPLANSTMPRIREKQTNSPHGKAVGRDLVQCSPAERVAHQQAMIEAHKNRFKDAHWTHTNKIVDKARDQDVFKESVAVQLYGHNKKFVMPVEHPTVSRAPRDVDNHLFTGAVHKEAESEQEMIARKIENHQLEIGDHKGREALKDEMDDLRRSRSSTWTDKAIPTSSDSEVPL